jgi:HAD superfamily hydrolase (TIGR01509 family)
VSGVLEAVVFDFDGLIVDTEWTIYVAAKRAFAELGHDLSVEAWSTIVGLSDDDDDLAWQLLCDAMGTQPDRAAFAAAYARQDRSSRDSLPCLPGVAELVNEACAASVPVGVASSSTVDWLHRHLDRLELRHHFGAIVGADLVGGVGKPAPDVYVHACRTLGADPAASVAIEDSAHGVASAKAAGMRTVAVPSQITAHHDLGAADLVVASVAEVDLARLRALVT